MNWATHRCPLRKINNRYHFNGAILKIYFYLDHTLVTKGGFEVQSFDSLKTNLTGSDDFNIEGSRDFDKTIYAISDQNNTIDIVGYPTEQT